jgi:general secretion pathway protein J
MMRKIDAGVTLIEVLVSLALFALIAGAGFSVLDQVLRAQSLTEVRLARLTEMQRMMHLVLRDFSESLPGSVQGDDAGVSASRTAAGQGQVTVTYALNAGTLSRTVSLGQNDGVDQLLLSDVATLRWQFLDGRGQWQDRWPSPETPQTADLRAVALTVSLLPPGQGELHRLIAVPRKAAP